MKREQTIEDRLNNHLAVLYGREHAAELNEHLEAILDFHIENRGEHSFQGPRWDERDLILITYGNSVHYPAMAPLASLKQFLDRHLRDIFSVVHVLPFFPFSSDEGFSVTDFRHVNPDLGAWEDIESLREHFTLMFDLVLNHMSREHAWFLQFLNCEEPGKDYVIKVDPNENLSLVVRPRSSPLLSRVRSPCGIQHVWATFSNDQIDLNYANPQLLFEMLGILLDYVRRGARIIRLDAVGFLWKEIGTSCIHLPQTHEVVKLFRTLLEMLEPGVSLLTETNVPHEENISYFGQGDEANMVYQFSLPPLLLHAIHRESTKYLTPWARSLDYNPPPEGCTYLNFTASHDGVGLRPLEGIIPEDEIQALLDDMRQRGAFVSMRSTSDGLSRPYELNISYFDAFKSLEEGIDPCHIARFVLSQTLPLCLRGVPAIYFNALTATPNDLLRVEETSITRNINRRKWDGHELDKLIDNPLTATGMVFPEYVRRLHIRRGIKAFHPDAPQEVLNLPDGLFGVVRTSLDQRQRLFALHNLTREPQYLDVEQLCQGCYSPVDLLSQEAPMILNGILQIRPLQAIWLVGHSD